MEKHKCDVKGCRNEGRYCPMHLKLKSAKKPEPIAKKSKKREVLDRTKYAPKAKKFVDGNPICQANIEGVCTKVAKCVHHKRGKNSEADLLNEAEWLSVCFACHEAIHKNDAFARQQGFIKSRHSESKLSKLNNNKAA